MSQDEKEPVTYDEVAKRLDAAFDALGEAYACLSKPRPAVLIPLSRLKELEWCTPVDSSCPVCEGLQQTEHCGGTGHTSDCWLDALIKSAEAKP